MFKDNDKVAQVDQLMKITACVGVVLADEQSTED